MTNEILTSNDTKDVISRTFYVLKAFAVLSIIVAHMPSGLSAPMESVRYLFSILGVASFFILAGYYFNNDKPFIEIAKTKLKTIIIPWILCASITYIVALIITKVVYYSYFQWVLGSGTWYYFIPMLLLNYVLFYFVRSKYAIFGMMALGLTSMLLTSAGIIRLTGFITDGLNVFNTVLFFGIGLLLKDKQQVLSRLINLPPLKAFLSVLLLMALGFAYRWFFDTPVFNTLWRIPFILTAFCVFTFISGKLNNIKLFANIGMNTYVIYLLHMQLANMVDHYFSLPDILYFVKPLLVLTICYVGILGGIFLAKKLNISKHLWLLGIRQV